MADININIEDNQDININIEDNQPINIDIVGSAGVWGAISGNIANQADLQSALALRIAITDFSGYFDTDFALKSTTDLSEGTNLYYTDTRVSANTSVTANTAKITNATHTGDVTGDTALAIDKTAITGKTLTTAVSGDFILISDTSDTGNLKKIDAIDFLAGGGQWSRNATTGKIYPTEIFDKVGIGTNNPAVTLDIRPVSNNDIVYLRDDNGNLRFLWGVDGGGSSVERMYNSAGFVINYFFTNGGNRSYFGNKLLIGDTNPTASGNPTFEVVGEGNTSSSYSAKFKNSDSTDILTIRNDGNVGIGTTAPNQALDIVGSIQLEDTTSATTGVIYKGSATFIHSFSHPTGDTAIPLGKNTFVGLNTGNFTMGSTATNTIHGSHNTGLGADILTLNTTGYGNVAFGFQSLRLNTTGHFNTAIGYTSLISNTTGRENSSFGNLALNKNTTGNSNVAVGDRALFGNTSGGINIAIGLVPLYDNTTGQKNIAIGFGSMRYSTTGHSNTALGYLALGANTTGHSNIAIGIFSGRYVADGVTSNEISNTSIYIGNYTRAFASGDVNEIVIGENAIGLGSNTLVLGGDSIVTTALKGNVGIGITAPARKLHISDAMRLEPIATAPSSPAEGDLYADSVTNKLRYYNGTIWNDLF